MTAVPESDLRFADLPGRRSADPLVGLGSDASVRIVELERTPGRAAHRHPLTEEVVYVAAGTGTAWIDGTEHPLSPGTTVRIPAGAPHATIPDEGSAMRLICFFPHPDLSQNIEDTDIVLT
jgi:quercetin dioxygenase-like cupin family protein